VNRQEINNKFADILDREENKNKTCVEIVVEQDNKIERLNDNWNRLRKWVVNHKHNENTKERYLVVDYGTLLGKMRELKGEDK